MLAIDASGNCWAVANTGYPSTTTKLYKLTQGGTLTTYDITSDLQFGLYIGYDSSDNTLLIGSSQTTDVIKWDIGTTSTVGTLTGVVSSYNQQSFRRGVVEGKF